MEIIKPTKQEVFNSLRSFGCCWLGGPGCECKSRQLGECYKSEEKRLVKTELTETEIKQAKENNKKAMNDLYGMLDELFG